MRSSARCRSAGVVSRQVSNACGRRAVRPVDVLGPGQRRGAVGLAGGRVDQVHRPAVGAGRLRTADDVADLDLGLSGLAHGDLLRRPAPHVTLHRSRVRLTAAYARFRRAQTSHGTEVTRLAAADSLHRAATNRDRVRGHADRTSAPGLDDVGKRLIEQLQQDGRRSYAALGKTVGLSEAAVRQRVQRMVDSGRDAGRRGHRSAAGRVPPAGDDRPAGARATWSGSPTSWPRSTRSTTS